MFCQPFLQRQTTFVTVGNHVIFCTYIRTERVGKFTTVSLIIDEVSCSKEQVPHRFCSKPLYERCFHTRCIFPQQPRAKNEIFRSRLLGKIQRLAYNT